MKTLWIRLCFNLFVAVFSIGALAQGNSSTKQVLDEVISPKLTAVQSDAACSQCISRCAGVRDSCRANTCRIIGAQSDTAQACKNATNDNPTTHKQFEDAVKACFAQERQCDAGCPCKH